jgi:hypothetical protein
MGVLSDAVRPQVEKAAVDFGRRLREAVAIRTPILTGRASASWNAAVGEANPAQKESPYNNPSGAPRDGIVQLDGFKLGDEIHVSNNRPYINSLNAGSSRKAPAGFVEATIEAIIARVFKP